MSQEERNLFIGGLQSKFFYTKYENTIILEDMTGIFQPMLRCKNPWLAMASRGFCALPRLKTPLVRYFSLIISSYLMTFPQ